MNTTQARQIVRDSRSTLSIREAIAELVSGGVPDAVAALKELGVDSDPGVRGDAVELLYRISSTDGERASVALLAAEDVGLRWAGLELLSMFNSPLLRESALAVLERDTTGLVRYRALEILADVGTMADVEMLKHVSQTDEGSDHEGRSNKRVAQEAIMAINKRLSDFST